MIGDVYMKALLINGSPRTNVCTFTVLTELKNTLSDEQNAGIENEVYGIRDKKQTQVHSKASLEQNVQNLP